MRHFAAVSLATLALALPVAGALAQPAPPVATSAQGAAAPANAEPTEAAGFVVTSLPLRNAGFEAPPEKRRPCPTSWFCTMHADPRSFRFEVVSDTPGKQYLRVTRVAPEPWALGRQGVPVSVGAGDRLRLSMLINTEATQGEAGPKIMLGDGSGNVLKSQSNLSKPAPGWRRLMVEVDATPGTRSVEIGFLIEGGGTTLFDDVQLHRLSPKDRQPPA